MLNRMRARILSNLFEGATDTVDGIAAGRSRSWHGNGDFEMVTLDNPGNSAVQMERREYGIPDASWVPAGDPTRTSIQRINLFVGGFEYQARILESTPTLPVRLTIRSLDQARQNPLMDELIESMAEGQVVGFAKPDTNGIVDYGDYEKLKRTTAFMFFCYDKDPVLLANFGGAWEKSGVDYRKLHANNTQFLLSVAIDNYINDGGSGAGGGTGGSTGDTGGTGGTGGGNTGSVGGPPAVRTGAATLTAPPSSSVNLEIYSSVTGGAFWGDAIDETDADKYEVSLNGIIVYIGTANYHTLNNLSALTSYSLSIVRFRDDGSFSPAVKKSNTTPAEGSGGGGNTSGGTDTGGGAIGTDNDGALTTYTPRFIDTTTRNYVESGQGNPAQVWETRTTLPNYTGAGYLRTSSVNVSQGQGALAVFTGQHVDNVNDRRIWIRVRAETAGAQFGVVSKGSGTFSTVTVSNTDWGWIEANHAWKALDASFQLWGITGGVSIDKVIVQNVNDLTVPTGKQGLRTS